METGKAILDGKVDFLEEVEVCKIKKDKYCLANDNCPDGEKEKKKFFSGHTILYYIDKNDPLGEGPKKPEKDSQFKNWEKAVIEWAEDSDKYDKLIIPDEECDKDDF